MSAAPARPFDWNGSNGDRWVANQAHWLARNAKADGNLGAQRDKLEVLA